MRLVAYTDDAGFKRLAWLRERDPDDKAETLGIPNDPPDISSLELPDDLAKQLHNALVDRGLVSWTNSIAFKTGLKDAAMVVLLDTEQFAELKRLYTSGPPIKPDLPFDLNTALDMLPCSDRQRDCIKRTFTQAGIRDLAGVENAPIRVGHICGLDIYQIIALLQGKEV